MDEIYCIELVRKNNRQKSRYDRWQDCRPDYGTYHNGLEMS